MSGRGKAAELVQHRADARALFVELVDEQTAAGLVAIADADELRQLAVCRAKRLHPLAVEIARHAMRRVGDELHRATVAQAEAATAARGGCPF